MILFSIGYHQVEDKAYPEIMYDFAKIIDLDRFWHDLYEISTATLLGHSDGMSGKEVVIEDITKKAAMIQTLKGITYFQSMTCDMRLQLAEVRCACETHFGSNLRCACGEF